MNRYFDYLIILSLFVLFFSACSSTKTVYRQNDLTMAVIEKEFIQKKRAVKIRFFVKKDLMYEDTGYIFSSKKDNYVIFQYYDHDLRNFTDLEVPLKNISEISFKEGAFEFNRNAKIAGVVAFFVSIFIAIGIWI